MSETSDILDSASVMEEIARAEALARHRENSVQRENPDEDAYGRYCLDCGDTIPVERVQAINAVRCVSCAQRRERQSRRFP
jgi:RNA polymerase-binding transcription factor DksA